ncbi:MAG: XRE family transcriptional regulator [Butyrivibrio sp.]|nr:XRE family transcriptional regulator [Butyrivibrio sp.]
MSYSLKLYDDTLLKFNIVDKLDGFKVEVTELDDKKKHLLPPDCNGDGESLRKWLKHRVIPANRAYVQNFLARTGLNEKDTMGIIDVCKGLSLNDCYWVVDSNFEGKFSDYNLYDNKFSRVLSLIAFTGTGSYTRSTFRSSPEFTTNGMLAKCWRREDGKVLLYKSGTEGFANSGLEPYSEFYAYQIASEMGLSAVPYNLSKWKGRLCSTCELFTDKDTAFVSAGRLVQEKGIDELISFYKKLGEKFYEDFVDMVVFDALIYNEDRHLGNFGFLIDSHSNKILKCAPLFDHGLSLFCYGMKDDLESIDSYASSRAPALFNSFDNSVKELITDRQRKQLRSLYNFTFKKHSRYNWDNYRLKVIEDKIRRRARELSEMGN